MEYLSSKKWKLIYKLLGVFFVVIFSCKNNVNNTPNNIKIAISGDEGIIVENKKAIEVKQNTKWKEIKIDVNKNIKLKDDYELIEWRITNKDGEVINDEKIFTSDAIVFALTKKNITTASYKVEHWIQNIEDDGYTKKEEETKVSKIGLDTEATAKVYSGFKAKGITQEKVKADGKTLIKIEYDRKITSIILDLDGGETTTPLEAGEGKKKLLKGKFESKVKVENPKKENYSFVEWKPSLPEKFSAEDDSQVYVAQWKEKEPFVYINGDERIDITDDIAINVQFDSPKTWALIKAEVIAKAPLKADWNNGDYGIYEWRENDENGKIIEENTPITKEMKVFAITNYMKFKMEGSKLVGYQGNKTNKPKGKIIIPANVTEVAKGAIADCREITYLDFSKCLALTTIGKEAFYECKGLETVNLSNCKNLASIEDRAFGLCGKLINIDFSDCVNLTRIGAGSISFIGTHIDLSKCKKLTTIANSAFMLLGNLKTINLSGLENLTLIGEYAFYRCENLEMVDLSLCTNENLTIQKKAFFLSTNAIIKLPKTVKSLGEECFGNRETTYCKQVIVPNDDVKLKVLSTNYPEARIKVES
ncbi:MAG: leucine-rich repeat domain-containing protein [Treponema sp.]